MEGSPQMSNNLNPTGLGTITTPEYADVDIRARRRAAIGPLSKVEVALLLVVAVGGLGMVATAAWKLLG